MSPADKATTRAYHPDLADDLTDSAVEPNERVSNLLEAVDAVLHFHERIGVASIVPIEDDVVADLLRELQVARRAYGR